MPWQLCDCLLHSLQSSSACRRDQGRHLWAADPSLYTLHRRWWRRIKRNNNIDSRWTFRLPWTCNIWQSFDLLNRVGGSRKWPWSTWDICKCCRKLWQTKWTELCATQIRYETWHCLLWGGFARPFSSGVLIQHYILYCIMVNNSFARASPRTRLRPTCWLLLEAVSKWDLLH